MSSDSENYINNDLEQIEKLHSLMEKGILTKEEFEAKKKQILEKQINPITTEQNSKEDTKDKLRSALPKKHGARFYIFIFFFNFFSHKNVHLFLIFYNILHKMFNKTKKYNKMILFDFKIFIYRIKIKI